MKVPKSDCFVNLRYNIMQFTLAFLMVVQNMQLRLLFLCAFFVDGDITTSALVKFLKVYVVY